MCSDELLATSRVQSQGVAFKEVSRELYDWPLPNAMTYPITYPMEYNGRRHDRPRPCTSSAARLGANYIVHCWRTDVASTLRGGCSLAPTLRSPARVHEVISPALPDVETLDQVSLTRCYHWSVVTGVSPPGCHHPVVNMIINT